MCVLCLCLNLCVFEMECRCKSLWEVSNWRVGKDRVCLPFSSACAPETGIIFIGFYTIAPVRTVRCGQENAIPVQSYPLPEDSPGAGKNRWTIYIRFSDLQRVVKNGGWLSNPSPRMRANRKPPIVIIYYLRITCSRKTSARKLSKIVWHGRECEAPEAWLHRNLWYRTCVSFPESWCRAGTPDYPLFIIQYI